ncbi:MAG: hypothetical protein RL095_1379 [Verrucomicrobiota bacterium]
MKPAHDHLEPKQFALAVKRLADALCYGADLSPFLGSGIDYVQSRLYQPGDAVKAIDWRITARSGKTHVKEYESPKQTPIYIVLDTSASMAVKSTKMSKFAWGVQLATGLGLVAIERMSPVGLMGCGSRKLHLEPSLSKAEVMTWAGELRHADLQEGTDLAGTLRSLEAKLHNKSIVLVISDLHEPESVSALRRMAAQHEVICLLMQDPAEEGRLGGGFFHAREAETGASFVARGSSTWLDSSKVMDQLRRGGIDSLLLRTDLPFLAKLRHFLKSRDSAGRRRL